MTHRATGAGAVATGIVARLALLRSSPKLAAGIRIAGWVLLAASAVFLVRVAASHRDALSEMALSGRQWALLGGLAVIYGAALMLLGAAWHLALRACGAQPQSLAGSMRAHTTAQLAKYVPGNVFHFLSRHMMHSAQGAPHRALALAAVIENALMLVAAGCIALACLALGGAGAAARLAVPGLAILIAALLAGALAARRSVRFSLLPASAAFAAFLAFFAIMAGVLAMLGAMLGIDALWQAAGGGIAAWIAGFITPGAPGGIGVREAAMVVAGGGADPDRLLVMGALLRVVTFCGDVLCALAGRLLPVSSGAAQRG